MTKPTAASLRAVRSDVIRSTRLIRERLPLHDPATEQAWAEIETFIAVALRVFAKTNLSKLRDETRTVEISARLAGHTVFDAD